MKAYFLALIGLLAPAWVHAQLASTTAYSQLPDSVYQVNTSTYFTLNQPNDSPLKGIKKGISGLAKSHRTELTYIGLPLLAGSAGLVTYTKVDADLQVEVQEHRNPIKAVMASRIEPFGRGETSIPGFSGLLAYGLISKDSRAKKAGIVGLSSYFISNSVTYQLKGVFNRHRPNSSDPFNAWDGPANSVGNNHSFPSAHTTTAFSAATVLASVYHDKPFVVIASYSVASLVGASRIYENHHWASDVLAGAVVGYLSAKGTLAAYEFFDGKLQKHKNKRKLLITPQIGSQTMGVGVLYSF